MEENSGDNMVLVITLLISVALQRLVIELDGDQHGDYEQIEKDKKRDKYLEELAKSTTPAGDKAL
jgi:hypothetical protein